jgi:hypothetical protein
VEVAVVRAARPVKDARVLVEEAEFEIDSIKEAVALSRAIDRPAAPKPPPLPLMALTPAKAAPDRAESRETLAGRLAMLDAS